jgi:hypothetical protein
MGYVAHLARLLCDGSLRNPRPDHAGPVAGHLDALACFPASMAIGAARFQHRP